jgi:hypothetical protein
MICRHLSIEKNVASGLQVLDQLDHRDHAGIGFTVEHGFSSKETTNSYTIDSPDQFIAIPAFHAVGMA